MVPLDREAFSHHRLTITATDSGYPPLFQECLVLIEVEDEDDNSPKFTRLFHAEIPEDLSVDLVPSNFKDILDWIRSDSGIGYRY